jgi:prepilin-type processing-associated H-X9-DG protein
LGGYKNWKVKEKVAHPSNTVQYGDKALWIAATGYGTWHNGGANFLFFDGHVEHRNPSDIPGDPDVSYNDFWGGKIGNTFP